MEQVGVGRCIAAKRASPPPLLGPVGPGCRLGSTRSNNEAGSLAGALWPLEAACGRQGGLVQRASNYVIALLTVTVGLAMTGRRLVVKLPC